MTSERRKISKSSRWNELVDDLFRTDDASSALDAEWPHPDYAAAAKACAANRDELEKLRRLSEDLESIISLEPGPGTLSRVAGVPLDSLRQIGGRCWREVLIDSSLPQAVWIGLRNYSDALKGSAMDTGTRRSGAIIHAICVARLEKLGEREQDEQKRKYNDSEIKATKSKLYLPACLAKVLSD